jgi:hypothetical protein
LRFSVTDALIANEHISRFDNHFRLSPSGERALACIGVELPKRRKKSYIECRCRLDWSERRPHVGSAVGAAMTRRFFELGWITRKKDTRAINISTFGQGQFQRTFGISLADKRVTAICGDEPWHQRAALNEALNVSVPGSGR